MKTQAKAESYYQFTFQGTWVSQMVQHVTLDFGSGHDPRVVTSSPASGSMLAMEPA